MTAYVSGKAVYCDCLYEQPFNLTENIMAIWHGYYLFQSDDVHHPVYAGITKDPERREREHQRTYYDGNVKLAVQAKFQTEDEAREWKKEQGRKGIGIRLYSVDRSDYEAFLKWEASQGKDSKKD